ncbi:hypothetical protein ACWD1W_33400 [Streptomyces olivaceoviridis]
MDRHTLAGLEAVHRIDLVLLCRGEAVELPSRIVGPQGVRQEAEAARDLAELCGFIWPRPLPSPLCPPCALWFWPAIPNP